MKDKRFDVVALGELLIDFTQNGLSDQGNLLFEANPGGAPANVLAMLRKLNRHCAFIGKVGKDSFGDLLENVLLDTGIDVSCLRRDERINTVSDPKHIVCDVMHLIKLCSDYLARFSRHQTTDRQSHAFEHFTILHQDNTTALFLDRLNC